MKYRIIRNTLPDDSTMCTAYYYTVERKGLWGWHVLQSTGLHPSLNELGTAHITEYLEPVKFPSVAQAEAYILGLKRKKTDEKRDVVKEIEI